MSTSLVICLAFLLGLIVSYKLLKSIIKNILINKNLNKIQFLNEEVKRFRKDLLIYYKKSSENYEKLDIEINKIIDEATNTANNIIRQSEQEVNIFLKKNTYFLSKKVDYEVKKNIEDLYARTASVAAKAIEKIIYQCNNKGGHSFNSKIISSLSHNLNKKLH